MLLIILAALQMKAEGEKVDLTPHIHGALRARYERSTVSSENRFQLRNARLTIDGQIARPVDYFLQTDLCDRGKMKILDAWGRLHFSRSLALQAGQFRLPFGTDCFKAPANYVFSNLSFVGSEMNNVRGVGAKITVTPLPRLILEAGAFNPTSIADHSRWCSTLAYAGKAQWTLGYVRIAAGAQTIVPDAIRINSLGASITWTRDRWTVEGEYINKHYTRHRHKAANGYNLWADYRFPVKAGIFNQASVQARVDGMTDHSSGVRDTDGNLLTDHPGRNRITAGATISYLSGPVHCDVRLSFEQYFYRHGHTPASLDDDNKICAELVVRF